MASLPMYEFPREKFTWSKGQVTAIYRSSRSIVLQIRELVISEEFDFDKLIDSIEISDEIEFFNQDLTLEEVNILSYGMTQTWTHQQMASIENTRQKFSGPDFKLSSQASQLARLQNLWKIARDEHRRLQMLDSRRRENDSGRYESTFDMLIEPKRNYTRRGVSMIRRY